MNAKPLFTEDRKDTVAYFCSKCRIVKQTQEEAEACCMPKLCQQCGKEVEMHHYTKCNDCQAKDRLQKEKERLRKAERVTEPSHGWVQSEGLSSNNGYFEFDYIHEATEDCEEPPLFVYDCDIQKWKGFDAGNLVSDAMESGDWFEDADEHVNDFDELHDFITAWNEKQTLTGYMCNPDRIIVLDEAKFEVWLNE